MHQKVFPLPTLRALSASNSPIALSARARGLDDLCIFSVQLQLSACLPHQFTCHSGKCVSMDNRCDNVEVGDGL